MVLQALTLTGGSPTALPSGWRCQSGSPERVQRVGCTLLPSEYVLGHVAVWTSHARSLPKPSFNAHPPAGLSSTAFGAKLSGCSSPLRHGVLALS